ncbi:MAG: peptidase M48 Ste24p [Candidatus Magnetoglobus multicellularis str. Araruama]|uniref:Peptidase M48 Ste24p n=1 Tax=Candidatus Magnetoglobus multicellularis str. Araruama TaxID=890399 RepID=A0A1V1P9B0_9BACT|nr:MAG: peptidase M48 Ste24p [Candidatus Magnetoglobus multicellularis str. Araruama]
MKKAINRRQFLKYSALSATSFAVGCAVNPVTGKMQLMLVSKEQEIQIDRQHSPHQFSADYGFIQDKVIAQYVSQVGQKMSANTHRTDMPYSFHCVNATYVNAYAFPGGSIAATRGILLRLENEAELAALMGHELGHVNARHTAEQLTSSQVTSAIVSGAAILAQTKNDTYGVLVSGLGALGSGLLLSKYSRDNEREADALGMSYMVKTDYGPRGFIGLMDMLRNLSSHKPGIIQVMFSTHPMSDERYATAQSRLNEQYASQKNLPLYRERYMDNTASLRAIKSSIEKIQDAEMHIAKKKYDQAEQDLKMALRTAPEDYVALMVMSKCQLAQNKHTEARRYAQMAHQVYPSEPQSSHISGMANIGLKRFDQAYQNFKQYENKLPGNPNTVFYKGYALEKTGRKKMAADAYVSFLKQVKQGDQAKHAYNSLVQWGYIKNKGN